MVDVVVRLHGPTDQAPKLRHLRVLAHVQLNDVPQTLDLAKCRGRISSARQCGGGSSGESRQGFAKLSERERCYGGGGRRQGLGCAALPLPSLYRGPGGRRPPRDPISRGRPKGGLAPQVRWGSPTPRVSNPRRKGRPKGGAPAHQGLVPFPLQPMGPSGTGGPTRWTPGTLPVVPVQYR